jgi:hypothetical protein
VVANLAFPATASWSSYANVSADVDLNAGVNTVSVIFNSSMGSSSYLNLDAMTVEPRPTCDSGSLPGPTPLSPIAEAALCSEPSLCWSPVAGATSYQVVIDGAPGCSTSGTCCIPSALAMGAHRWFVEASTGCAFQAGAAAHFVSGAPVAPPLGPVPADGSTASASPILSWGAAAGALSYDVSVDGAPTCAGLTVTSCDPGALAPGLHTWTVVAHGTCGSASAVWSFSL